MRFRQADATQPEPVAAPGSATAFAPAQPAEAQAPRVHPPYGSRVVKEEPIAASRPKRRRKRRWRRRLAGVGIVIVVAMIALNQANGAGGAFLADFLRATIGPAATARLEAAYLDLSDRVHAVKYQLGLESVKAPWAAPTATAIATHAAGTQPAVTATPDVAQIAPPALVAKHHYPRPPAPPRPMPLRPIPPAISPSLPGEGVWTMAGLPAAAHGALPPVAKTFLRPDRNRPYALATILQFDLRAARLHIMSGIEQPGGVLGNAGTGLIPSADIAGHRLLAVLNGGFKYADGAYGLMSGGKVYVPPVWGAATIAVTKSGHVFMGAWGLDHRLTGASRNLAAWRQNAGLLVDHHRITTNTHVDAGWGLSIMNDTYTWRSGIGLTNHNTLIYVAGNSLSASTLARALYAAGAASAMELDINPFWVRAFTYTRDTAGTLTATALDPAMPGNGLEYLYGHVRDFFYLTR